MCGIFGYLFFNILRTRQYVANTLVNGLKRLEYRGFDSSGIAVDIDTNSNEVMCIKALGNVDCLRAEVEKIISSFDNSTYKNRSGLGHTRWATHGIPAVRNSHPHTSGPKNEFLVVHNGMITNYKEIKQMLINHGFVFESDTDTETVPKLAKLMHEKLSKKNPNVTFREVVVEVLKILEGSYALIFKSKHYPGQVIAARNGSPLILGIKRQNYTTNSYASIFDARRRSISTTATALQEDNYFNIQKDEPVEYFLSSDASAIIEHTNRVLYIEDGEICHINENGNFKVYQMPRDGNSPNSPPSSVANNFDSVHSNINEEESKKFASKLGQREIQTLKMEIAEIMKNNYDHFMMKEIMEQPESLLNTMRGRISMDNYEVTLGGIKDHINTIKQSSRFILIACGTSYNSAIAARKILEELSDRPVNVELSSDFLDRTPPVFRNDVCVFISQSGETADTIKALQYCKSKDALCVGITNTVGSSLARGTHCGVHINAGSEIGVASTKAYTSQVVTLIMFALLLSQDSISKQERRREIIDGLRKLSSDVARVLKEINMKVKEIAKEYISIENMIILARGYQYATCIEAALKIKELSYLHCEALGLGELKHGPLALINEDMPLIVIATKDQYETSVVNGINQVLSRSAKPILIVSEGDTTISSLSPKSIEVPSTVDCLQGIINVIPMQLLAYWLASLRGYNVDQPRSLAKSVTVV